MRKREGATPIERFNQMKAQYHILFGLSMYCTHMNRPFSEAILIYRERTGDTQTEDKRLYQVRAEMIRAFQLSSDEVTHL